MANVTEKDIINHLKEKIKFHQAEAKKIESLLSAFTGSPAQPKQKQVKEEAEAVEQAKELKPAKKDTKKPAKAKTAKKLAIPADYNPGLSWNSKITFAINELGDGVFNEDIAAKITELEPELEIAKVSKQISGLLSVLKNKGGLKAERTGKKDKYSLIR